MPLTDESKKEEPTLSELFPITDINISKVPLSKDEIESRTKIQVGWTPEHEEMFEKSGLERYKGQYNMSDMESHVWTWRGLIERDAHDKPYIEQMNAMAEKLAQDPLFTPHREDVINIFKNMEDDTRWPTFLMNKGIFELYTQEFIEKLTDYLTQQAQKYRGGGKCRILEVGAG